MPAIKGSKKSRYLPAGSAAYRDRKSSTNPRLVNAHTKTLFAVVVVAAMVIFFFMMLSLQNEGSSDEIVIIQDPQLDKSVPKPSPTTVTLLPKDKLVGIELEQKTRIDRLRKVCLENAKDLKALHTWRYKYDRRHNVLYCPIPKSGWSSWKRVFFYINGAIKSMDVEIGITSDRKALISDMAGFTVLKTNSTGKFRPFTFAFVRNPWERLVSAYINKALDWNYTRILHSPCEWETMKPYQPSITFVQFLSCIVSAAKAKKKPLDMHWIPMWTLCDFCQINYNAIGHMETIDTDAKYVIEKLALNIQFPKIFSSRAHNTSQVLHPWYSSVPANVIQELRELYKYDFLLHDYSDIAPGWENKL